MNTKILREFQVVYEKQSIHKAAGELFITPQGLGKNIKQLEIELQTLLFERTKQGMIPTASGRLLYKRSGEIMQQLSQIDQEIQQLKNQKDRLRIGCAYGAFNIIRLQDILDFIHETPDVQVEYYEYSNSEIRNRILTAELDYGIVVGRENDLRFCQKKLAECPVVILVYEGHPFYRLPEISFRQLEQEKLLSMNEEFWIYHELLLRCRECGFEPRIAAKSMDGIMLQKLCVQKLGLAVVPEIVVEEMNMEHLHAVPLAEIMNWEIYGISHRDTADYDSVKQIETFLTQRSAQNVSL